jgi:hypothetical protein
MVSRIKRQLFLLVVLTIFISSLLPATQVRAEESPNNFPNLSLFIENIKNGNANLLSGVYVRNKIAFQITQQPLGNPAFISNENDLVTQFSIASEVGNIGLLAHNYLAGANFSQLEKDDVITLIYGDGHTQKFVVDDIQAYRATDPLSPYSHFENLNTEEFLSAEQLFNKVYRGEFHLTLQTCIEENGNLSWGRLFIVAKPINETPIRFWRQNILAI